MNNNPDSFSELDLKMIKLAIEKAKEDNKPLDLDVILELSKVPMESILKNQKIVNLLASESIELNRSFVNPIVDSNTNVKILDLESLDIFEGFEDINAINSIEVIEDVDIASLTNESEEANEATIDNLMQVETILDKSNFSLKDEVLVSKDKVLTDKNFIQIPVNQESIELSDTQSTTASLSKFVGGNKTINNPANLNLIPSEIKKACVILGVDPSNITKETVMAAWKKELTQGSLHPDLGGDTDSAKFLNTAKDALLQYIESLAPKLGKKFGKSQQKPQI